MRRSAHIDVAQLPSGRLIAATGGPTIEGIIARTIPPAAAGPIVAAASSMNAPMEFYRPSCAGRTHPGTFGRKSVTGGLLPEDGRGHRGALGAPAGRYMTIIEHAF